MEQAIENPQRVDAQALQDNSTLISLLEQRSATYGFLARLYREEIEQEQLEAMHEMLFPLATGNEKVDEGNMLIATYLSNLWADSLSELRVDYAATFIGQGIEQFSAAYPYESVYTSEKRLVMQEARDEVVAIYRTYGIGKSELWKDGEDHIALELEFERFLGDRTIEALREGNEDEAFELLTAQKQFLENHLLGWVPMMTADMHRFAHTKMYQGLASLTEGFLETDEALLLDLLSSSSAPVETN